MASATSKSKPTEKQSVKSVSGTNGGARPGAGRKPGVSNKRTAELVAKAESGGLMPLDYMLSVMRDNKVDRATRLDAAKASAGYVHAKLSSIEVNANVTTHESSLDDLA
jgi:hypothetical protein